MGRLVTFGCSYTFGEGLVDCYKPENERNSPPTRPSRFAWPNHLAKKLNRIVVNESWPGSGNLEIFYKILKYNFRPNDLVIIMWSHFIRFNHFIVDGKNYEGIRQWRWNDKEFIINEPLGFQNAFKNYLILQQTGLYLNSKNVKNFSFIGFSPDKIKYPQPSFLNIPNLLSVDENYNLDLSLDNQHFGNLSHKRLAEILYNKIINELR